MANERKVQDDLRRIIGVDGFKKGIAPPEEKPPVEGRRGIVYFDSSGNSQTKSGTPGEDMQPGADEEEGGRDADQGDGQGDSGGSNGGNTVGTDGVDPPYPLEEDATEGDGILSVDDLRLGDQMKGLTGLYDCATGDPVDVRFDGQFTAPDGWEDANTPPEVEGYEAGYFWVGVDFAYSTKSAAVEDGKAAVGDVSYPNYWVSGWSQTGSVEYDPPWLFGSYYCSEISHYSRQYKHASYPETPAGSLDFEIWKCVCTGSHASANYCTVSPVATAWPDDKPMQLSYDADTAKWKTNQYDSNVTPEYSQPTSTISLCDGDGNPVIITPTADGGKGLYIPALGYAVFSDENGKITGFGDGAAMTARLPR